VGRSFRAPTWTERYYRDPVNRGRADLVPEKAWSGEVGLDLSPGRGVTLALTGFSRKADQLIDWARPVPGSPTEEQEDPPWETRNIEEADFLGLEMEAGGPGPLGLQWGLGGMWLSVDASENSGFISKYALRPIQEQVTMSVRRPFAEWMTAGLNVQRVRRRGEDPYWRLDVRSRFSVVGQRIYVDATNLLGQEYPDITGALAPGRAVFVGLEFGPGD
jgi:iron complex outermembrane receptor protein